MRNVFPTAHASVLTFYWRLFSLKKHLRSKIVYKRISCTDLQITDVGIPAFSDCGVKCEASSIKLGQPQECRLPQGCISASWVRYSENFPLPYFTWGLNAQSKIMQWSDFRLEHSSLLPHWCWKHKFAAVKAFCSMAVDLSSFLSAVRSSLLQQFWAKCTSLQWELVWSYLGAWMLCLEISIGQKCYFGKTAHSAKVGYIIPHFADIYIWALFYGEWK